MSDVIEAYYGKVLALLAKVRTEKPVIQAAAKLIADAYQADRGIYIFGCTHSAILSEDVFYRAGAPAFWRPLWGPGMSIATTPGFLTSAMEKNEDVGRSVIQCSRISEGDVLVIVSTSGKNAAPVAAAEEALKRGVRLILITSSAYRDQKGNHSSIPNLWSFRDKALILDNHVPCGDAMITEPGCPMGPGSTIVGSFLMHAISAESVRLIAERGLTPPVFLSSNAPGGLAHNEKLLEQPRVREAFLLP